MDRNHSFGRSMSSTPALSRSGGWLPGLTIAALLLPWSTATHAQQATTLVPASVSLKPDDLQSALTQAQQDVSLPADVKAKVVDLYKQALDESHMADEWTAKSQAFKKESDDAPHSLSLIKSQLDDSAAEPTEKALNDCSLDKLKQGLAQAGAASNDLQAQLTELQSAVRRRAERVDEVRVLDAAAKQKLDEIDHQLLTFVGPPENLAPLDRAQRRLLMARKAKITAERGSYEQELPSYEATRELLRAKLDLATHRLNQAEKIEKIWQDWVARRSTEDAQAKARTARWAVVTARPEVLPLAQKTERLAELRRWPS
jgi:6-pyruvoyl-tetrahydropterin synthase